MICDSLAALRASFGLAVPTLLVLGCPSDTTPATDDTGSTSSDDASSSGSLTTTIDPDTSTSIEPTTATTTSDSDSSSSGDPGSSSEATTDAPGCGNGDVDGAEECDGDNLDGRDCASEDFIDGTLACNADCTLDTSGCNYLCGDGDVQGDEQCEDGDLDGADCVSEGFDGGDLACANDCSFDLSGCENYTCGDALQAGTEICDGIDLAGETCVTQGFDSGALACAAGCDAFDTSSCYVCGDNAIDPGESCDTNNLAGEDCISQGLDGGVISCASDCTFDLSECVGCGNGDQEGAEACDGNDFAGVGCDDLGFDGGQPTCAADCTVSDLSCFGAHTFCTSPAAAIGPGAGALTVSTIPVAGLAGGVLDVDVDIVATHTQVGDLDIDVRHVDTDLAVSLADDQCGAGDDIGATFDQAAVASPSCIGTPTISGDVQPLGNLDSYVGAIGSGNGTWELSILDQAANNGGALGQWCVSVTTGSTCATPFPADNYDEAVIFADAADLVQTRMTIAWDGVNLWSSSGGSPDGNRVASHDAVGNVLDYYQPNLDLRSVFTRGDGVGPLYSRAYADPQIRVQDAPGSFVDDVVLQDGFLDDQSAVVWDDVNAEFIAHSGGTVTRWDENGALIGEVVLDGFGELDGENDGIASRGIAVACGYYLTYYNGLLSAWDVDGNRLAFTTLNGAGTSGDSYYSYSYAQGLFFVNDGAGGNWRGYDVL